MKKSNILLISAFIVILFTNLICIMALEDTNLSITNTENKDINISIYVINLGKFDVSTGAFTADFYLSIKCDSTCPNQDFEFMNGRASNIDKIIDEPNEKFYRILANLNSPIDLKKFPFDSQKIEIIIEDKKHTIDEISYIADNNSTGIDDSILFTGWKIGKVSSEVKTHYYPVYDETYSQYVMTIPIYRITINSFIKTILPVAFIIFVMLSSFVLDPDKLTTRIAMVSSALVASVMFHVSLSNQIPPVAYMTFMDKFMVLTYFVLLMSFILNIFLMELTERKKKKLVKKIHEITEFTMLIIVPILYILLFIFFL